MLVILCGWISCFNFLKRLWNSKVSGKCASQREGVCCKLLRIVTTKVMVLVSIILKHRGQKKEQQWKFLLPGGDRLLSELLKMWQISGRHPAVKSNHISLEAMEWLMEAFISGNQNKYNEKLLSWVLCPSAVCLAFHQCSTDLTECYLSMQYSVCIFYRLHVFQWKALLCSLIKGTQILESNKSIP